MVWPACVQVMPWDQKTLLLLLKRSGAFNVNIFAQAAGAAAITDDDHVKKSRETNEAGKQYLYREFENGLKYTPTEANFIC